MVISVDKPLFKPLLPKSRADFNASSKKPLFFSYQKAVRILMLHPKSRCSFLIKKPYQLCYQKAALIKKPCRLARCYGVVCLGPIDFNY
jgi:hypothetical protein